MKKLLLLLLLIAPLLVLSQINIIPQPVHLEAGQGNFIIDRQTSVSTGKYKTLHPAAHFLINHIREISGIEVPMHKKAGSHSIELSLATIKDIGEEGYLLTVSPTRISIQANTPAGIIYGIQSILQTLPAIRTNEVLKVPAMEIKDYPRFSWRGMHLDVCRHFFSPDFIKEYIDLLATYKLNRFHWHLVDDQGWRIEIKQYPLLTEVGAWRVDYTDIPWNARPQAKPGEPATYGGYYTQEQIRDIVKYAQLRNVTIVPEIEMPGHVASAIAAYPYLSCTQQKQLPLTGGNYEGMASNYCAGNDSVFTFLENVLTEVMGLFPSKYIHIGGDEVNKTSWMHCPKCQKRIKTEGLKDVNELQSYFIKRIEKFVNSKGRQIIGWDEILEGGLAPGATVMSWRGESGGIAAAKMHHHVIMTPGDPLYFDHYQGDPATEPLAIGGFNPLKKVYAYNPIPEELNKEQAQYILGAQANLWAEFITTVAQVEYMVLPRMPALSEVDWTPLKKKDWEDFQIRLQSHFDKWDALGINYSKGNFKVNIQPVSGNGQLKAVLSTDIYKGVVHYTTNGDPPTVNSMAYTQPISIDSTMIIKAITVVNGRNRSLLPSLQHFVMHKAIGEEVAYLNPVSPYYQAEGPNILTDGVRGTENIHKYWHGFSQKDLVATLEFPEATSIHSIAIGFLQKYRDWIMLPQSVTFEISEDGSNFREVAVVPNDQPANTEFAIKDFTATFPATKVKAIRIHAKNGLLPEGHPGVGKPGWLFADEIIVQ